MDLTSLDTYYKIGDGRDQAQRGIFTWANNRDNEGFIQERRDRFFGSPEYLIFFDAIVVTHVRRQASNHALIVLDPNPQQSRSKTRLFFTLDGDKFKSVRKLSNRCGKLLSKVQICIVCNKKLKGAYRSLSNGERETS